MAAHDRPRVRRTQFAVLNSPLDLPLDLMIWRAEWESHPITDSRATFRRHSLSNENGASWQRSGLSESRRSPGGANIGESVFMMKCMRDPEMVSYGFKARVF
jgi:hypothetical protein